MTLQEKIDRLPRHIVFGDDCFELTMRIGLECFIIHYDSNPYKGLCLFAVENRNTAMSKSQRLEDVIDRALKVIENNEWEK